jgi:pimeloyl-ACP methyl ester carboxylesterase
MTYRVAMVDTPTGRSGGDEEGVAGRLRVAGCDLDARQWGDGAPGLVVLHDGLGSVAQWRSLPARLAAATGRTVVAYDRPGHGRSAPVPSGPWPVDWMHDQADVLLAVLDALGADRPLLLGHSDGGSISLLAAARPTAVVSAVVALAPHSWVEPVCSDEIGRMRAMGDRVPRALARFHSRPEELFEAWSGVWVSEEFSRWDIRSEIAAVDVPTLIVQGSGDEYATETQAVETAAAVGANARHHIVPDAGHLLHHQVPGLIVELVADMVGSTAVG